MDFGKAFTYVFEDPDWVKKVLLAAVFSLIPIVGTFVAMGWGMEAGQRVIRQDPQALPEVDFGKHLGQGFRVFLIYLVYSLPLLLFYIPIILITALGGQGDSSSTTMNGLIVVISLCCGGLMLLYALVLMVTLPAAMGNYLATDQVGAAFRFKEVIGLLRASPGAYLITLLGGLLTGTIASLGSIACVIGVVVTSAYAAAVMGHLIGQSYRAAIANGAQVS
jgi:hypothetical protein